MVEGKKIEGKTGYFSWIWYLKQLLPLTYESEYYGEDGKYCSIWKMWFGKILWCKQFKIEGKKAIEV